MESRTEKLPKGRSYPLKPSALAAAIARASLDLPVRLTRWDYKKNETFEATFYPKGSSPRDHEAGFWVACGAVPSDQVAEIRALVEADCLPKFIEWARAIQELDGKSPLWWQNRHFSWNFPKAAI